MALNITQAGSYAKLDGAVFFYPPFLYFYISLLANLNYESKSIVNFLFPE